MSDSFIPRLVAAGALVVGGGFWAYQRYQDTRPVDSPVAFETEQQKAENIQAAFAAAANVKDEEVEGFVQRLQQAVRARDNEALQGMVSLDRMIDALVAGSGITLPQVGRAALAAQLGADLVEFFDPTVVQTDVKRIHRDPEGNLVVYLRMIDENRIMMKSRWWLYPDGEQLRWWDSEDLQMGMRLSTVMAAGVSTASAAGNADAIERFSEVAGRSAEISMEDEEQVRGLLADLDALDVTSLPRSFRHVIVLLQVSAHLALGEHEVALQQLDALDREPLDALDMPARHFLRASVMLGLERWDEAAQSAQHFLELLGDDAEAYNQLGIAEVGREDREAARAAFDKGLADDPLLPDNYAGIAFATEDAEQVAERLRAVTETTLLGEAAQWLADAEDPEGLAAFLEAAKQTHPAWDGSSWEATLAGLTADE